MSVATSITVRVPLAIRRQPGRKTVVTPEGAPAAAPSRTRADPALAKSLARDPRGRRAVCPESIRRGHANAIQEQLEVEVLTAGDAPRPTPPGPVRRAQLPEPRAGTKLLWWPRRV